MDYPRAATLHFNMRKTVAIPLASGCQEAACISVSIDLADTHWASVVVSTSAILIGIFVGSSVATGATREAEAKCLLRQREIGSAGLSPESGLALSAIIALPTLHHTAQFYPASGKAARGANLGLQILLHLPHGFCFTVLRNLGATGFKDSIPADVPSEAYSISDARRLGIPASNAVLVLSRAFAQSEHRALASLDQFGGLLQPCRYAPIGWDGPALAIRIAYNSNRSLSFNPNPKEARGLSSAASFTRSLTIRA
jgi:hypothetical protein